MGIERKVLKQVIMDQHQENRKKRFIYRNAIESLKKFKDCQEIIIISGLRRSGKSTLMHQMRLKSKEADYFLNFDDDRLVRFELEDFQLLLELFGESFGEQNTFYFDEIQNIEGWERFIRRLHDQGHKVYITGSNATLFSQELGTRLTGRYLRIELYPYSFKELVRDSNPELIQKGVHSTKDKIHIMRIFSEYRSNGGLPEYIEHGQKEALHNLYEGILYRDIVSRYKVKERAIKELVYYLASNVGKELSFNSLRKNIGIGSATTVSDYASYLEGTYLCFFISQFDHSLKKQIQGSKKCYFIDHGLARIIGFRSSEDRGRMLENLVFIELKRRGEEIYFHKQQKECDFLLRRGHKVEVAIQVCLSMENSETRQREIAGLVDAMQCHNLSRGLILTLDEEGTEIYPTKNQEYEVEIQPIWKWLTTH